MALLQRTRILPNERIDLPDYNRIEDFVCADFKAIHKNVLSNENFVFSGFVATGLGTNTLSIAIANSSLVIGGDDGVLYIGAPSLAALATSSLSPGSTNYVEIFVDQDTGGSDSRAFWDPTAAGGTGAEFSQIIDTFTFLQANLNISTSNFSGDSDKAKICEVDVNGSGVITAIRDRRDLFFRLGRGINPTFTYPWSSRTEPANTQFNGADKDIKNQKQMNDALMDSIREIKGTAYWYELATTTLSGVFRNTGLSVLTAATPTARFAWSGTNLKITDDNLAPSDADVLARIRLFDSTSQLNLTRQDDGKEVVTVSFSDVADFGVITLDQDGNLIPINYNDSTSTIQTTWNSLASVPATIFGSPAEKKLVITYNAAGAQVDVLVNANTLTKNSNPVTHTLSIKQGMASDESIAIADDQVLWVQLPDPLANVTYDAVGVTSLNYRVTSRGSVPLNDDVYWLAYRDGTRLYLRGLGELEAGESHQISDETSEALAMWLGFDPETATSVPYTDTPDPAFPETFTDQDSLVTAISALATDLNYVAAAVLGNAYDEVLLVVSGAPANSNEVTGPVNAGNNVTLPTNSRAGAAPGTYVVGDGRLMISLNGLEWSYNDDFLEVGSPGSTSTQVTTQILLEVGDKLKIHKER